MLKTTKRITRRHSGNVIPFTLSTNSSRRRGPTLGMHDEQIVRGKLLSFPTCGSNDRRPMPIGDSPTPFPLLDDLMSSPGVGGHLNEGVPAVEDLQECFHPTLIARDQLSRQGGAIVPVTAGEAHRTICPVGRARTPVQFNKELALRLKSARVAAGYDTMPQFAKDLGIELERYKKWESGRTPFQHEYLAAICELTGKDANYFYGIQAKESVIRRAAP